MAQVNVDDYRDIDSNPLEGREPVSPESEFFHSVYIAGRERTHDGITEKSGMLQVRGVDYNLNEINMIITHIKPLFAKIGTNSSTGQETIECFCFQTEEPWKGTSGRFCGRNKAERAADPYCEPCRSQLIVAGVYCDAKGTPKLQEKEDGKSPIFIFLRGKGTKYMPISDYVNSLSKIDPSEIGPLTDISKEENLKFEKRAINHKRFVTKVVKGTITGQKGNVINVFNLEKGIKLPDKVAIDILKLSKKIINKFTEKFDWSKRKSTSAKPGSFTPADDEKFDAPIGGGDNSSEEKPIVDSFGGSTDFNFDDVKFV
jgi:hypothetical protein